MAAVSHNGHWGGLHCGGVSYNSPKQQFLRYSNQLLHQYQHQGSSLASESGSTGDYHLNGQEIITSPQSVYQVMELLGRGTFGQVLRCWKKDTNEVVAMKILKNLPSYTKQGQVEVDVLSTLSKVDSEQFNFVHAYESFSHHGHICIVFECLQINLYDYLKRNRFQPLPLKHIRPVAQQVLICLKKLRELGLVHADLKPENIMLVDPDRHPFRVKVIDFGSATCRSTELSTTYLQSRYYRAPEVVLGMAYDEAIDMWSLGCVLAELFLGWPLFPGATEYDQISYISQMLGDPPHTLTRNAVKMSKFYRRDSQRKWVLKAPAEFQAETGIAIKEARKFIFTSVAAIGQVSSINCHGNQDMSQDTVVAQHQDKQQFIALLDMLLTFDPKTRADPSTCSQHPFVTMLHLSMQTNTPCVRDWIECMQVCCQSRTTTSSPPNSAPPAHNCTATPTVFSAYPQLLYTLDSTTYLPGHTHPSLVPLPSHWVSEYKSPVVTPQGSVLVDTGYVSAESSPTIIAAGHSLMDFPKVELVNAHHHYPASLHSPYWFMLQQAGYFVNHSRL